MERWARPITRSCSDCIPEHVLEEPPCLSVQSDGAPCTGRHQEVDPTASALNHPNIIMNATRDQMKIDVHFETDDEGNQDVDGVPDGATEDNQLR